MAREPIPTWYFVLVVVRKDDRFMLVHEAKHGQLWYLPAGRVEPGEDFVTAAQRETLEEAGIPVGIDGILRIEHTVQSYGVRMRIIFVAHPLDDTPPKHEADEESLEARWVTVEEAFHLPLRGFEVLRILQYVSGGAPVYPADLITYEGAPFA
jgi:phosphatase NudJ